MVGTLFEPQLGKKVGVACTVNEHGTQKRSHNDERDDGGEQCGVRQTQRVSQVRLQIHGGTDGDGE